MRRMIGYIIGGAVALLFATIPINLYFMYKIPHTPVAPDPTNGFIYPYNNHGVTHYVTWLDHELSNTFVVALVVIVPVIFIAIMWAKSGRKS